MASWKNGIAKITLPTPFPVGDVNVYVVKGERLTLVDAGVKTEAAWNVFTSELKELGLSPRDFEQVVLTHHHPDHIGFLEYLSPEMEVYGHPINQRWLLRSEPFLSEHQHFFYQLFTEFGISREFSPIIDSLKKQFKHLPKRILTGTLVEGDIPIGLSEWRVIETPGHAQSHIGLFREKDGTYIAGDHLLAHISPNPIIEPPLPGTSERPKSQLQYNASLQKILQYPIKLVYTGHGEEITDVPDLVEKRLQRQHQRAMTVKKWLKSEALTVFEVCIRLFPKVYQRELMLTISETVAQLDYLASIGELDINMENGALSYMVKS
ncbi:MBL fold metallo-hydrolase [Cytobacillus sp. Hz8]|uniref:MBL fold metallo-hydrolase n=1 Tax=Cytobacillus sp. Hz8 TaxID=3347168 RepID=UPI0035D8787A